MVINTSKKADLVKKKKTTQPCPMCGEPIGVLSGSFDAICKNCGYKDPCCE